MTTVEQRLEILIIEDSDEDFAAIQWALRKAGREYLLIRFKDCDTAIEHLRNKPFPSLILLDLNLSGSSGHDTLKIIKTDAKLRIIPVVVLTTSTDPKDVEFCYFNGTSGYINKPVNFEKFSKSLKILMDYWFEAVLLP
jgi:CheY-like chemotaxis protein